MKREIPKHANDLDRIKALKNENKRLEEENKKLRKENKMLIEDLSADKELQKQIAQKQVDYYRENQELKAIIEQYKKFEKGKKELKGKINNKK